MSSTRGIWQALLSLRLLVVNAWRSLRQAFVIANLVIACAVMPACECSDPGQAPQSRPILACEPQHERIPAAPLPSVKTTVPGAMAASFGVVGGDATLSLPLVAVPGRAGVEPDLRLSYSSAAGDGVLGVGFSLSGASAITRCPKTLSLDGEIRSVQYDADDAFCLDGKRLVIVAQSGSTIEYRTFPDTLVKVIGHFENASAAYFEAFLPSGDVIAYGKTPGTRPMASGSVPRAWLASEKRDMRIDARCRFTSVAAWARIIPLDALVPHLVACTGLFAVRSPHTEAS